MSEIRDDQRPEVVRSSVANGAFWTAAGYSVAFISQFVGIILLARLLTPESFGVFAIAVVIHGVLAPLIQTGIVMGVVQRRGNIDEYVDIAWSATIIISTAVATLGICASPIVVGSIFKSPEAIFPTMVMLSLIILDALRNPRLVLLLRKIEMKKWFLLTTPPIVLRYITAIAFAYAWASPWALVAGYAVWRGAEVVTSYMVIAGRPRLVWDKRKLQELYAFGGWLQLKNITQALSRYIDMAVVGSVMGTAQLGLYDRASTLARMPQGQVQALNNQVLFPMFSALQDRKTAVIRRAFKASFDLVALIVSPIILVVLLYGEELVNLLLGAKWVEMASAFQLLIIAIGLETLVLTFLPLLRGLGHSKAEFFAYFVKLVVTSVVIFPLTQGFGIVGAATAILIGTAAALPLIMFQVYRLGGIQLNEWAPTILICAVAIIPCWLLGDVWRFHLALTGGHLIVAVLVSIAIYFFIQWLFFYVFNNGPIGLVIENTNLIGLRKSG